MFTGLHLRKHDSLNIHIFFSEIEIDPYNEGLIRDNPIFGLYDDKGNFRRVALPITPANNPKTHRRDRSRSFAYGEYE